MAFRSDIAVITALPEELAEFHRAFEDLTGNDLTPVEDDPHVLRGHLPKRSKPFLIFAAHQHSPGMVSAAALATRMITRYAPQYLVMLGITAAFQRPGVKLGDVLIADFVSNYQDGKVFSGGEVKKSRVGVPLDPELKMMLQNSKESIMKWISDRRGSTFQAHMGVILTGSQVVADDKFMKDLENEARKLVGVEMEGVAVFQAASETREPSRPKPILIKGASDFGTKTKRDDAQNLAASNSALFFLKFAQERLEPATLASEPGLVEVVSWEDLEGRGAKQLIRELDQCTKDDEILMISITAASLLAPKVTSRSAWRTFTVAFKDALVRRARCRVILLNPDSVEAEARSSFESPRRREKRRRMLMEDSARVRDLLPLNWEPFADGRLQIAYSDIGLAFGLWLFPHMARLEPYHFGKLQGDRDSPESALCGFSHLWVRRETPEYDILVDHFDKLWSKARPFFPSPPPDRPRRVRDRSGRQHA